MNPHLRTAATRLAAAVTVVTLSVSCAGGGPEPDAAPTSTTVTTSPAAGHGLADIAPTGADTAGTGPTTVPTNPAPAGPVETGTPVGNDQNPPTSEAPAPTSGVPTDVAGIVATVADTFAAMRSQPAIAAVAPRLEGVVVIDGSRWDNEGALLVTVGTNNTILAVDGTTIRVETVGASSRTHADDVARQLRTIGNINDASLSDVVAALTGGRYVAAGNLGADGTVLVNIDGATWVANLRTNPTTITAR